MKRTLYLFTFTVMVISIAIPVWAQDEQAETQPAQFASLDVYIDSGETPLAAYQFELVVTKGDAKIVGIEGCEYPGFTDPPYYDPAALKSGRVIVAAFNTGEDLPTGKTRIATLHMRTSGETIPEYSTELAVAATSEGKPIQALLTLTSVEGGNDENGN